MGSEVESTSPPLLIPALVGYYPTRSPGAKTSGAPAGIFVAACLMSKTFFFFSDPPRVILAPPSLQGLQGCREKQKVLLIKQALQALRARILAPPPQVRCAGDDDVSCLHRGGLWPARCQGMRSTRLGGGVEGELFF